MKKSFLLGMGAAALLGAGWWSALAATPAAGVAVPAGATATAAPPDLSRSGPVMGEPDPAPPEVDRDAGMRRRLSVLGARQLKTYLGTAAPPARFIRVGTVLPLKIDPKMTALAPTLIDLKLTNVAPKDALDALAKATKWSFTVDPPGYFLQDLPPVTMDLEKQPAMEALLEYCNQTGLLLYAVSGTNVTLRENVSSESVGTWCVAGPFAFVICQISHEVPLGTGQSYPLEMRMVALAEPGRQVLAFPSAFDIKELTDERGHSLVPADVQRRGGGFSEHQIRGYSKSITQLLAYPEDAGRRIKTFSATAAFSLQTSSEAIKIDKPLESAGVTKKAGDVEVTVGKITTDNSFYRVPITINRGDASEGDWNNMQKVFNSCQPRLLDADGKELNMLNGQAQAVPGDSLSGEWLFLKGSGANVRVPMKFVFDVPTAVQSVSIPLYFEDLPLP
jgi:hypothetical protein